MLGRIQYPDQEGYTPTRKYNNQPSTHQTHSPFHPSTLPKRRGRVWRLVSVPSSAASTCLALCPFCCLLRPALHLASAFWHLQSRICHVPSTSLQGPASSTSTGISIEMAIRHYHGTHTKFPWTRTTAMSMTMLYLLWLSRGPPIDRPPTNNQHMGLLLRSV